VHPVGKSTLGRKMIATFFNGLGILYHHAEFGEDRTSCASCRCKNVVFVFLFFCHAPCLALSSFEECIVQTSIVSTFMGQF